jgi:plasmid stability protein
MITAAQTVTRNAPETDSRKTQVTVSRAIHVLSTEDEPRQVVTQRDRTCRNLESEENQAFRLLLRTWPLETALREPVTDLASFRSKCSFPTWENRGFHENCRFCLEIRP